MKPEPRSCLLCNSDRSHQRIRCNDVYGGTPSQAFWQCDICEAIYLFPVASGEDDKTFYENQFDKWMAKRSGDESWSDPGNQFLSWTAREMPLRKPWLDKLCPPGTKVLEIGSSSGFMLKPLQNNGCDVLGVELSHEYREFALSKGIETVASMDDLGDDHCAQYDILLHYYVLEHVTEPLSFLRSLLPFLKPGGKMMFEVPNGNDPLTSLYKVPQFESFYWWRAHHWYFTPKSLGYLLERLGRPFEIFPGQRYDLSNHVHWLMTGQPGGFRKYSHIFSPETERLYAEDLKRSGHCDYLVGIIS
jgi:2-polyprenyl-3-methyl-5-hydroxy-6-metoxy-1,4-benzoquinol methylase